MGRNHEHLDRSRWSVSAGGSDGVPLGVLSMFPARLSALFELTKLRISGASTFTAAAGYLAFRPRLDPGLAAVLAGTLLMAMASSALNEVQERDLDALMPRTQHRPIPRGAVGAGLATGFAVFLACLGFGLLVATSGWMPALLALVALLWYNGFYTPLKRLTPFAVVPGSIIGALPPAIGWTAAGGYLVDPPVVALATVLFLWQVPHFWLLSLMHQEGYARAGFPTLAQTWDGSQIRRMIFTWTCAAVASCAALPAMGAVSSPVAWLLVGAGALWMLWRSFRFLGGATGPREAFMEINLFMLILMAAVFAEAVIASRG